MDTLLLGVSHLFLKKCKEKIEEAADLIKKEYHLKQNNSKLITCFSNT